MPHVRPLPPAGTDNRPRGHPALAAAVSGSLLLNYYFVSPLHAFTIAQPANIVAVAIFLLTAVLVSQVVDIAREAVDAGGPRPASW